MLLIFYLFLLSIGGAFVQRTVGFGFGIFVMTMLPLLMPSYGEAVTLSGMLSLTQCAFVAWKMRRWLAWRKLWGILAAFFVVSTACIFWLKTIDDQLLHRILGVTLILISLYFALFSHRIHLPTTLPWQLGTGTASGLMGGFFGMQGPPAVLYFVQTAASKEEYLALAQTFFLLGNLSMTIVRAYTGFLTQTVAIDYLFSVGGVALGTALGAWMFRHIPGRIFRYIIYAYIAIAGASFLLAE